MTPRSEAVRTWKTLTELSGPVLWEKIRHSRISGSSGSLSSCSNSSCHLGLSSGWATKRRTSMYLGGPMSLGAVAFFWMFGASHDFDSSIFHCTAVECYFTMAFLGVLLPLQHLSTNKPLESWPFGRNLSTTRFLGTN